MRLVSKISALMPLLLLMASCGSPSQVEKVDSYPAIFPDYVGVTIPESIKDLPFKMEDGRKFLKTVQTKGDTLFVSVKAWNKGDKKAVEYKPFPIVISHDEIDPYVAYRLIEPGYESWRFMGIYQREIASMKESPIVTNRVTGLGCMNCHSFQNGDPSHMLFHTRGVGGGTMFASSEGVERIDLTKLGPGRQGVYPMWNPDGRYVVFSTNSTFQGFTINHEQPLEVFDSDSDILIMDTKTSEVTEYKTDNLLETFPGWSPDGKTLYYCAADTVDNIQNNRGKVHYKLMARQFKDGSLVGEPEVIYADDSSSVSFPRVYGDKIMFTRSSFGTFPIWHKEADLWLLDLPTGQARSIDEINSDDTESYHSWSSNGKWVVFSSRRIDGRYTRLFIAHHDGNGNFSKPFLLPQKSADFDLLRMKSYNIPEFVKGRVPDYRKQVKKLY